MKRFLALVLIVTLTLGGATNLAHAQTPLTGSGSNLPLGPVVTTFPLVVPTYVDNGTSFTGTWDSTASPDWQGTFTGTGPIPGGSRPSGDSNYDFSGLSSGVLPEHSYFAIVDLDNGSGSEHFTLKAYDSTDQVISSPWLDSPPVGISGTGSGPSYSLLVTDTPGWNWNTSTSTYTFDGTTVAGNPSISLALWNNQDIASLDFSRDNSASSFNLGAPIAVPEPSTIAMLAGAGIGLVGYVAYRRKRRNAAPADADIDTEGDEPYFSAE